MTEIQGFSSPEEAELPFFKSHEEAKSFFEEKYGERFVFEESLEIDGRTCFFYRIITDEDAYIKGITDLNANGTMGVEFKKSYQPIQIMEDGSVRLA